MIFLAENQAEQPPTEKPDLEIKKDLRIKLFRFLLSKYADIINDFEKKTVGEIKGLVDKDDLSIQSLVENFKNQDYDFEKDYLDCAKKAFEFVQKEMNYVKTDISLNYWLSPREIMQEKIGDDKDLSIFLCTLLHALNDLTAEIIVAELADGQTHAFVMTEYKDNTIILDPSQKHSFEEFTGKKSKVIEQYSFEGQKIVRFLYRFNRQNYEQFI